MIFVTSCGWNVETETKLSLCVFSALKYCFLILVFFLQGLGFGSVNKIFLKYPYKWWPDDFTVFSVLNTNETAPCIGEMRNEIFSHHAHKMSLLWNFLTSNLLVMKFHFLFSSEVWGSFV